MVEARIVEIAEYGPVGSVLHRGLVLRGIPQFCFALVTACADLAADEAGDGGMLGRSAMIEKLEGDTESEYGGRCDGHRDPDPAHRQLRGILSGGLRLQRWRSR